MRFSNAATQRRTLRWIVLSLCLLPVPIAAYADSWVPAAGSGSLDLEVRQYDATDVFLPGEYGTSTLPGSELRYTMLRLTGVHGLGHRLSVEYDLRAGHAQKIRIKHGRRIIDSATGIEDQEIGLNLALSQSRTFADSIVLNVVVPTGSVSSTPALGVGRTAIEPDFQAGVAHGPWRASVKAGSRVFLDGGAAQMRLELDGAVEISRRIEIGAVLFYVRTVALRNPLPAADNAERYDLLRPGVRLKYRLSRRFKPFVEYEQDLAGQGIHAGRRVTVGFSYDY